MVKIFNLPKPLNHPPCSQPMPLTKDEKTAWKRCTAPRPSAGRKSRRSKADYPHSEKEHHIVNLR